MIYKLKEYKVSPSYIEKRMNRTAPSKLTGLVYEMLFTQEYRVPAFYTPSLAAYEVTDQIKMPIGFTTDDLLRTLIDMRIDTYDAFKTKSGDFKKRMTQIAIERLNEGDYTTEEQTELAKSITQSMDEDVFNTAFGELFKSGIMKTAFKMEYTQTELGWLKSTPTNRDLTLLSTYAILIEAKEVAKLMVESTDVQLSRAKIQNIRTAGGLIGKIMGTINALDRTENATGLFPAYYVHKSIFSDMGFVSSNSSDNCMFTVHERDMDERFFSFSEMDVKEVLGVNNISTDSIQTFIEYFETVLFMNESVNSIFYSMKPGHTLHPSALENLFSKEHVRPFLGGTSDLQPVIDLVEKIHLLLLTDAVFGERLSAGYSNVRAMFDRRSDVMQLVEIENYFSVVTTVYETLIKAIKIVASLAIAPLSEFGAVPSNDIFFSSAPNIGFTDKDLAVMESLYTDRNRAGVTKRFERYKKYREVKNEHELIASQRRHEVQDLLWPWNSAIRVAGIVPNFKINDMVCKPYNNMTAAHELMIQDKTPMMISMDMKSKWNYVQHGGRSLLSLTSLSLLCDEVDFYNIATYVTPIRYPEPEMYFDTDLEEGGILQTLVRGKLAPFRCLIPLTTFAKFSPKEKRFLEVKSHTFIEIRTFDHLMIHLGGMTTIEDLRSTMPAIANLYLDKKGAMKENFFYKFDSDPFEKRIVYLDDAVVNYEDYIILNEQAVFNGGVLTRTVRDGGLFQLSADIMLKAKIAMSSTERKMPKSNSNQKTSAKPEKKKFDYKAKDDKEKDKKKADPNDELEDKD